MKNKSDKKEDKNRRKRGINECDGIVKLPYKTNSLELKKSLYK